MSAIRSDSIEARPAIGGWLLLLCISLTILSPALTLYTLVGDWTASADDARLFPVALDETILTAAISAFGILAGIQLWRRASGAVALAKTFLLAYLAGALLLPFALIANASDGVLSGSFLLASLLPLMRAAIAVAIWYSYLSISTRVRATYPASEPAYTVPPQTARGRLLSELSSPALLDLGGAALCVIVAGQARNAVDLLASGSVGADTIYTLLNAASFAFVVASAVAGWASDRWDARQVLLVLAAVSGVGLLLLAAAQGSMIIGLGVFLCSIGAAAMVPAAKIVVSHLRGLRGTGLALIFLLLGLSSRFSEARIALSNALGPHAALAAGGAAILLLVVPLLFVLLRRQGAAEGASAEQSLASRRLQILFVAILVAAAIQAVFDIVPENFIIGALPQQPIPQPLQVALPFLAIVAAGVLFDVIRDGRAGAILSLATLAGGIMLLLQQAGGAVFGTAIVLASAWNGCDIAFAYLLARDFGTRSFGTVFGAYVSVTAVLWTAVFGLSRVCCAASGGPHVNDPLVIGACVASLAAGGLFLWSRRA